MESNKLYWLISAPKTKEDTFNLLNKKTHDEHDYSRENRKFGVPDLKVGTLDTLMNLSDELQKVDMFVEGVTKKIANQLSEVLDAKPEGNESLTVNNNSIDNYLTFFRWDETKFSISLPLKQLTEQIHNQIIKLDEELKTKSSEYNTLNSTINADMRKQGGSYLTKDFSEAVQQKHVVESEYLQTLFFAVPRYSYKEWEKTYPKLTEYVLPRSSELIVEDSEYGIFRVILFKKVAEDFRNLAREKKFTCRDFVYDPTKSAKSDRKKLEAEREKQRKALIRWCKTNFSESFVSWIHLKAIRIFVESVLRYGLPTNFQAMLLQPRSNKIKNLKKVLHELYGHLSSASAYSKDEEEAGESFYPYVFLEINLDFKPKTST